MTQADRETDPVLTVGSWRQKSEQRPDTGRRVRSRLCQCHHIMRMGDTTNNNTQSIADYLAQLLKDKKQLAAFPNVFIHMERLLDDGE